MTIHDFDMARFLLGEEPVAVSAHASVLVDKKIGAAGDFDSVSVIWKTASGKQAIISTRAAPPMATTSASRCMVPKGMIAAEKPAAGVDRTGQREGYTRPPLHDFFMTRYLDAYANEIAAFITAATSGKKAAPSGADGLVALKLADAALKSATSGKTVRLHAK